MFTWWPSPRRSTTLGPWTTSRDNTNGSVRLSLCVWMRCFSSLSYQWLVCLCVWMPSFSFPFCSASVLLSRCVGLLFFSFPFCSASVLVSFIPRQYQWLVRLPLVMPIYLSFRAFPALFHPQNLTPLPPSLPPPLPPSLPAATVARASCTT